MEDLRYPIGEFRDEGDVQQSIDEIAAAPAQLSAAVDGLSPAQLDISYRPGGWTVRQLVHHIPDSHLNSYVRFRLALTEQEPTIKPYDQEQWAGLPDARTAPIAVSLSLLESLHQRWVLLLRALMPADWRRTFRHPEMGVLNLEWAAGHYAWHGRHHIAQITALRKRMGWS